MNWVHEREWVLLSNRAKELLDKVDRLRKHEAIDGDGVDPQDTIRYVDAASILLKAAAEMQERAREL